MMVYDQIYLFIIGMIPNVGADVSCFIKTSLGGTSSYKVFFILSLKMSTLDESFLSNTIRMDLTFG